MPTTLINTGFPSEWKAGKLETDILNILKNNLDISRPNENNLILNSTWFRVTDDLKNTLEQKLDNIVVVNTTDPFIYFADDINKIIPLSTVKGAGYIGVEYGFDFWALATSKFFKTYTEQELEYSTLKYTFVSYNRKPHWYRVSLVDKLFKAKLNEQNIITLGRYTDREWNHLNERVYTIPDNNDYTEYGAKDVNGDAGPPNDVYSLGKLDVWQSHFVNIVSETVYEYRPYLFVSEKIYKPIIGMRPFIVNADTYLLHYLKNNGFDTFEDLWPEKFNVDDDINTIQDKIINILLWLSEQDTLSMYQAIKPRLLKNRKRFFEFAQEQERKINNFFL